MRVLYHNQTYTELGICLVVYNSYYREVNWNCSLVYPFQFPHLYEFKSIDDCV